MEGQTLDDVSDEEGKDRIPDKEKAVRTGQVTLDGEVRSGDRGGGAGVLFSSTRAFLTPMLN